MKFLNNLSEWYEWAKEKGIENQPERFPCFAFEVVLNWNYQESEGSYLYAENLEKMQYQLKYPSTP